MAHMPEIKPDVNKEPEKRAGFLSALFGGASGSGGLGGLGGGSAAGGGVLATKAGLLALVLAGTTVAGGVGLVGYKLFGPPASDPSGQNVQLFATKPKAEPSAPGASAASKDGSSDSLTAFAKVNSGALKSEADPGGSAAQAGGEASASSASGQAAEASSGDGASKSMLNTGKKFGALSSNFGGGASAPSAGGAPKGGSEAAASSARSGGGSLSAMSKGRSAASASAARSVSGVRRDSAKNQAFFARDTNRAAQSSYAGGRAYDNAAPGAGSNIGDGTAIGLGGPGTAPSAQPKALPAPPSADKNEQVPAPPPKTYDVTPYAKEMASAQMLLMLGVGLLYLAQYLAARPINSFLGGGALARVVAGLAAAVGAAIALIGLKIRGDQSAQGLILMLTGAGLAAAGYIAASNVDPGKGLKAEAKDLVMELGGAAVLIGMIGGMLARPRTCKSKDPDKCVIGAPASETSRASYIV